MSDERNTDSKEERRDPLRRELAEMRKELHDHIEEEMPAMRAMQQELGTLEQIRERRIFIEAWIKREQQRDKLRIALIEKGLLVSFIALIGFVAHAIWNDIIAAIRMMLERR